MWSTCHSRVDLLNMQEVVKAIGSKLFWFETSIFLGSFLPFSGSLAVLHMADISIIGIRKKKSRERDKIHHFYLKQPFQGVKNFLSSTLFYGGK